MIVTSWAKTDDKYEFTFTLFNSDEDDCLNLEEFSIIVKCFVNGFRRWAHKRPLTDEELIPLSKMLFEKIDIDYSLEVDMKEVSDVLKNLPEIRDVFAKYEKGKDVIYSESILKKRLITFCVYKIHINVNNKNEIENEKLDKNKNNKKKSIKKETQDKLTLLYNIYMKILQLTDDYKKDGDLNSVSITRQNIDT